MHFDAKGSASISYIYAAQCQRLASCARGVVRRLRAVLCNFAET